MPQLSASLLVRLIDGVSGPARAAASALRGIGSAASSLSGKFSGDMTAHLRRAMEANSRLMHKMRGSLFDATAMGASAFAGLKAPTDLAREFESILLDIAQKADLGDEKMAALGKSIRALAPDIYQTSADTAKGVDFLAGMGLDPDKALEMMRPIGRAATAYRAEVEDLAKAGFAVFDNLKVDPKNFTQALDVMAQAGKEGAFEIKDMAREFPSLTAAAQALGMQGVDGVAKLSAALQIARKGAGTSSEAATNTANLMQKIISPETTKKFKSAGIDIRKELKKTQKTGGDVFEMIAKMVDKATKGDRALIGDFFQDKQVQDFLRPLLENIEEYKRIRDKSKGAKGVADADFERRIKTGDAQFKKFNIRLREFGLSIGAIVLPPINEMLGKLTELAGKAQELAERFPRLTRNMIIAAAGFIGLRVAASALGWAFAFMRGGALAGALVLTRFAKAIGLVAKALTFGLATRLLSIARALGALALAAGAGLLSRLRGIAVGLIALNAVGGGRAVLGAIAGSLLSLGRAILLFPVTLLRGIGVALWSLAANPVGAAILAIVTVLAALGVWVSNNWKGILTFFSSFGESFKANLGPGVSSAVNSIVSALSSVWDWLNKILGPIDEGGEKWKSWGQAAGAAAATVVNELISIPSKVASLANALYETGSQMIQSLWEGAKAKFGELIEWVKSIPSKIRAAIGSIDLSGLIKMPSFSFGGGGVDGKRAGGGPVTSGKTYLVGEKGPELFTPSGSGRIVPNDELSGTGRRASGTASSRGGGSSSISVTFGNIVVQGVQSASEIAEQVGEQLEAKIREVTRGLQADLGYTS